jgi:hypothetical protein
VGQNVDFAKWLEGVSTGKLNNKDDRLTLPNSMCVHTEQELMDFIYPDSVLEDADEMAKRVIVASDNDTVDRLNALFHDKLSGVAKTYLSSNFTYRDNPLDPYNSDNDPANLQAFSDPGLPPHELKIKPKEKFMIMRNMFLKRGIANGAIVEVVDLPNFRSDNIIFIRHLRGPHKGQIYPLPRFDFYYDDTVSNRIGLRFHRFQFPIRPCMVTTIHKSQAQTYEKVGVHMLENVHAPNMVYVALSRVTSPEGLKVFTPVPEEGQQITVENKVFWIDNENEEEIIRRREARLRREAPPQPQPITPDMDPDTLVQVETFHEGITGLGQTNIEPTDVQPDVEPYPDVDRQPDAPEDEHEIFMRDIDAVLAQCNNPTVTIRCPTTNEQPEYRSVMQKDRFPTPLPTEFRTTDHSMDQTGPLSPLDTFPAGMETTPPIAKEPAFSFSDADIAASNAQIAADKRAGQKRAHEPKSPFEPRPRLDNNEDPEDSDDELL